MTDSKALIERLLDYGDGDYVQNHHDRIEAADHIENLEADNARLRETEARIVTAIRATMCDCSGKFIADAIEQGEYRNG